MQTPMVKLFDPIRFLAIGLTKNPRTRSWTERDLLVMGALHLDYALDHCPFYELYSTAEEDPGRA